MITARINDTGIGKFRSLESLALYVSRLLMYAVSPADVCAVLRWNRSFSDGLTTVTVVA